LGGSVLGIVAAVAFAAGLLVLKLATWFTSFFGINFQSGFWHYFQRGRLPRHKKDKSTMKVIRSKKVILLFKSSSMW
jgi:hypothetical protein